MNWKIWKKITMVLMSAVLVISLGACASEPEKIVIGEGDWDSNAFHDQVVKVIIEEGYGVETDIIIADTAVMISGLKNKTIDLALELWADNVPTYPEDIENGDYVKLATNFDDNVQGLYVPAYLVEGDDALLPDLKSVQDLPDYVEYFIDPENPDMGIIYGGPEGWSATAFLHNKMEAYGLDEHYNFKAIDSGATLNATLASAYAKGEPWLGYNWEPTWVMGLFDLVLLEDTPYSADDFAAGIGSFPSVDVQVVSTPEFVEAYPEITEFLKQYTTSSQLTSEALAYMQENEAEADVAAKWFLEEKQDIWAGWVTEEAYDKIMAAIQ
ncbi:MAG: ABC transporter substrate-binding protein [Firmicutes bacterium HGW-Firmicutes-2]|jgi:glycine betaine/proline transport system substrate-binding protein|nr:MAG: ABC transporter substrate-binding protein [Firmicutes bacterium HGW-Firmicutes-2]